MAPSWYYAAGGRQVGPISEAELESLVTSGAVRGDTLVWRDGMAQWQAYNVARPDAPAPVSAPTATAQAAPPALDGSTRFCTQCGQPRLEREMVSFGGQLVCYSCKDLFAQRLREQGAATPRFRYAGFWIRVLARLIDTILLYIVLLPITFLVLGSAAFSVENREAVGPLIGLNILLVLVQIGLTATYDTFFVYRFSATPGKMVVGKKVVTADGQPLTLGRALGRHFAMYLSSFTLLIGYIIAAFDDQKRTLHDRICDTRVIAK